MRDKIYYLFFAIGILLFFQCSNEDILQSSTQENKLEEINATNQILLEKFMYGGSTKNADSFFGLSNLNIQTQNGMLVFPDNEAFHIFLAEVDKLHEDWDYSNDNSDDYWDTPEEINHLGDPALNAVDQLFNHNSLRQHYNLLEYNNENFFMDLDYYVGDPEKRIALNEKLEIQIGSNIYKYLYESRIAQIENADLEALEKVRQFGVNSFGENIKIFNAKKNSFIDPPEAPTGPTATCQLLLTDDIIRDVDGDPRKIRVKATVFETGGGSPFQACGATININWGDGNSSNGTGGANHTYNLDLDDNECKSFNVKITGTLFNKCRECPAGKQITKTVTVNICNIIVECNEHNFKQVNFAKYFEFDNKNYKIQGEYGQVTEEGLLIPWNEKIWGKTIFKRQRNNGSYGRKKPGNYIEAKIKGFIFTNECSTKNTEIEESKRKRERDIVAKKNDIDDLFGTREDPYSDRMYVTWEASMEEGHSEKFSAFFRD